MSRLAPHYRGAAYQATVTSADAQSATQVKAAVTGESLHITDIVISTDTAMNIQIQDDSSSPVVLMEQLYMPANSVFSKSFTTALKATSGQDIDVIASASGNISVTISGYSV